MENASKALIMAGTILIAILVLTVGVYIFINFSEFARGNDERQAKQELIMQNNKFLKFDGRTDLKAQDMRTVANLVKEYNNKCLEEDKISILYGSQDLLQFNDKKWFDLFEQDTNNSVEGKIQQYTCAIKMKIDNEKNEIVEEITFTRSK